MGHKGVSKRKPKQIRVPPAPENASSSGRGDSKDAPQTATQPPKAAVKNNPDGGTDNKRKKR